MKLWRTLAGIACASLLGLSMGLYTEGRPQRDSSLDFVGLTRPEKDPLGNDVGVRQYNPPTDVHGEPMNAPQPIPLPLTVRIQNLSVMQIQGMPRLVVEILLRNSGNARYLLPVSGDPARTAVRPGNKGRRQLIVKLAIHDPDKKSAFESWDFHLDGSETVSDSLRALDPGDSVTLRFDINLTAIKSWVATERRTLQFRAIAMERKIADDRYFISEYSADTPSESVELSVGPGI
jgi:hypothetical protein